MELAPIVSLLLTHTHGSLLPLSLDWVSYCELSISPSSPVNEN
jgi:hypothetical protein